MQGLSSVLSQAMDRHGGWNDHKRRVLRTGAQAWPGPKRQAGAQGAESVLSCLRLWDLDMVKPVSAARLEAPPPASPPRCQPWAFCLGVCALGLSPRQGLPRAGSCLLREPLSFP